MSRLKKKINDKIIKTIAGMIIPAVLLLLWHLNAEYNWWQSVFFPSPEKIPVALYDMIYSQNFSDDFCLSLGTVIKGFLLGGSLGFVIAVLTGTSKIIEKLFVPLLNILRQIPPLALYPFFMLLAGIGMLAKVSIISYSVFFPVFLNTYQGIKLVPKEYIEVAQVFEFSRLRLLKSVILPATLPGIFVGVRYGAGFSWALIVAAEMMGGAKGLGYLLIRAQELLMIDQLFAVLFVIGAIGFFIDSGLRFIERKVLRWKREVSN
ncbi:MAG: ABC transporter permease [Ignavibacteria bacterium]